jgi:hypothetical protein
VRTINTNGRIAAMPFAEAQRGALSSGIKRRKG